MHTNTNVRRARIESAEIEALELEERVASLEAKRDLMKHRREERLRKEEYGADERRRRQFFIPSERSAPQAQWHYRARGQSRVTQTSAALGRGEGRCLDTVDTVLQVLEADAALAPVENAVSGALSATLCRERRYGN